MSDLIRLRLQLLEHGYSPIPVVAHDANHTSPGKGVSLLEWQTITLTPELVRGWAQGPRSRDFNTGLRTGLLSGLDIDVLDAELVDKLCVIAFERLGHSPLMRVGRAPKILICYRATAGFPKVKTSRLIMPDGNPALVEALGAGQQFVGFGIHPDTLQPYRWLGSSPLDVPLHDLPLITAEQVSAYIEAAGRVLRAAGGQTERELRGIEEPVRSPSSTRSTRTSDYPPPTREEVLDALACIPNTHDWHGWFKIGAAIFEGLADDGEDIFVAWSAQSSRDNPVTTREKWRSFRTSPATITVGSLFWEARRNGWLSPGERERASQKGPDARRKETAKAAFRMLRMGMPTEQILTALHAQNASREEPLLPQQVDETVLWAVRTMAGAPC